MTERTKTGRKLKINNSKIMMGKTIPMRTNTRQKMTQKNSKKMKISKTNLSKKSQREVEKRKID